MGDHDFRLGPIIRPSMLSLDAIQRMVVVKSSYGVVFGVPGQPASGVRYGLGNKQV